MPICTPEQANNKQCRVVPPMVIQTIAQDAVVATPEGQPNKVQMQMRFPNCMGPHCMSWVWHSKTHGYCGRGEQGKFVEELPPMAANESPLIERRR